MPTFLRAKLIVSSSTRTCAGDEAAVPRRQKRRRNFTFVAGASVAAQPQPTESAPGAPVCAGAGLPTDSPPSQRQPARSQTSGSTADLNSDGEVAAAPPSDETEGNLQPAAADSGLDAAAEPQQVYGSAEPGMDADLTDGGAEAAAAAASPQPARLGAGQLAHAEPAGGNDRAAVPLPRYAQDIVEGLAQSQLPPELPSQKASQPLQSQPDSPRAPAALENVKVEAVPQSVAAPAVAPERAGNVEVGETLCNTYVTAVCIAQLTVMFKMPASYERSCSIAEIERCMITGIKNGLLSRIFPKPLQDPVQDPVVDLTLEDSDQEAQEVTVLDSDSDEEENPRSQVPPPPPSPLPARMHAGAFVPQHFINPDVPRLCLACLAACAWK